MTLNLSYQAGAGIWSFSRDTNDIQGHHSVVAEEKKKVNQGLFKVISDMPLRYRWAVVSPTVAIDNAVSLGRYQLVKQWKMEMVLLMNMSACKLFDIEKLWWKRKKKKILLNQDVIMEILFIYFVYFVQASVATQVSVDKTHTFEGSIYRTDVNLLDWYGRNIRLSYDDITSRWWLNMWSFLAFSGRGLSL